MSEESATITELSGERFKQFTVTSLKPSGLKVRLSGACGSGKSNLFNIFRGVVDGKKDLGDAVKHGEEDGVAGVRLSTGEFAVRTYTDSKSTIKITGAPKGQSAIETFKSWLGPFTELGCVVDIESPERRRWLGDQLLKSAGVDVAGIDGKIDDATEERKVANRDAKNYKTRLEGLEIPEANIPEEEQSAKECLRELSEAREKLDVSRAADRFIEAKRAELAAASEKANAARQELLRLATLEGQLASEIDAHELPECPTSAEIEALEANVNQVEITNIGVRSAKAWRAMHADKQAADAVVASAEAGLNVLILERKKMLDDATFPHPQLTVIDGEPVMNGERFANLSRGQRLMVGLALHTTTKGKLNAVFLDNGDALDAVSQAEADEYCEEHGIQMFIAHTDSGVDGLCVEGADFRMVT
jgi:hypothetical protein